MPLTPEDVRNKQFSTVRLREGYDMDEVDAFLDEVEAELTRLGRDNEDLAMGLDELVLLLGGGLVLAPVVSLILDHLAVLDQILRKGE